MANLGADDQTSEESEDMSSDEEVTEDFDSVDGLKKFIKKKLAKFASRIRVKKNKSPDSSIPTRDFSDDKDKNTISDPERKQDSEDDIYTFNYPNRGLALIIDNEHFQQTSSGIFQDRPGSSYDSISLRKTFKRLGFHVLMFKNLSSDIMYQTFMSVSQDYDHAAADCFVCVILSHGYELFKKYPGSKSDVRVRKDILFGVNGEALTTEEILNFFDDFSCPGLVGKPRLFFFQACRGDKVDEGVKLNVIKKVEDKNPIKAEHDAQDSLNSQVRDDKVTGTASQMDFTHAVPGSDDEVEGNFFGVKSRERDSRTGEQTPVVFTPAPLYKDCLVMYATPPGHYAWRRANGSWFIESLTKVLNSRETRRTSLMNALVKVCRLVAQNYESVYSESLDMHQKKEMPVIQAMLVKDVVMTKKVNN